MKINSVKDNETKIVVVGKGWFWVNSTPTFHVGVLIVRGGVHLRVLPHEGVPYEGVQILHKKKGKRGIFQFWPPKI